MFSSIFVALSIGFGIIVCDLNVHNTTAVATNIESTIGTPEILVDPTLVSTRNTTVEQYEVSVLFCFVYFNFFFHFNNSL